MPRLEAGSLKSIIYVLFQLIDEILHAFSLVDNATWRYRFCQWCHRHDGLLWIPFDNIPTIAVAACVTILSAQRENEEANDQGEV